ncbi:MAG: hypothetical protein AAF631_09835, partial [Pseudomonadota bacterium]
WVIAAFAMAVWLMASALTGFEKNRLQLWERVLRPTVGLATLLPTMTIALPAFAAGAALILLHRFLGGEPSPIESKSSAVSAE